MRGVNGAVSAAEQLATNAGIATSQAGGNAVDAAIATNAVMVVVAPTSAGWAATCSRRPPRRHHDRPQCQRPGRSGADPDGLRRDGQHGDAVAPRHPTAVPGCVDGWIALHDRFGTMPLADLLAPATRLAQSGFPASPLLAGSLRRLDDRGAEQRKSFAAGSNVGARSRRPGVAAASARSPRAASCVLRG